MVEDTVSIRNFSKSFGVKQVVTDLSFEVKRGEIFAFLGANGSGKTTTIRCLLGILKATKGKLLINGTVYSPEKAKILGYLPEERGLYLNSKVLETLIYFGQLKGLSSKESRSKAINYLSRVGLSEKSGSEIKDLSSGQQQKLQLGITVINDPKLLILDEPTKGLDPVNSALLMDLLKELNKKGSTIVFITHSMEEVEKIADRLVMIKEGKRVLYGDIDEIKSSFGTNTIHINFDGQFPKNEKLFVAKTTKHSAEISPAEGITTKEIIQFLSSENLDIKKLTVGTPSLQEIFLKIYGE